MHDEDNTKLLSTLCCLSGDLNVANVRLMRRGKSSIKDAIILFDERYLCNEFLKGTLIKKVGPAQTQQDATSDVGLHRE